MSYSCFVNFHYFFAECNPMTRRANLWSLIVAHLVCTALGLWIQQRYMEKELQAGLIECGAVATALDAETAAAALALPTAAIRAMTFLWMNGLLGVVVFMVVSRVHDEFARRGAQPAAEALKRTTDLVRTQDAVIFGLAKLADSRDQQTGAHLERISLYASALASALRRRGLFSDEVTRAFVQNIGTSAALHDIGKVGVADSILLKPGLLTPHERLLMQQHSRIGAECLEEIERRLGSSNFLRMAHEIAAAHHERWDGLGYPARLQGREIPLSARIVAIADVYDAMSTKRVYKDARSHADCVAVIRSEAGKQFDPQLVEVFLEIEPAFENIARQFAPTRQSAASQILEDVHANFAAVSPETVEPAFKNQV